MKLNSEQFKSLGYESWACEISQLVSLQNNIKQHGLFFGIKICFDDGVFGENNSASDIVNFWMLYAQKVMAGRDIVKESVDLIESCKDDSK